MPQNIPSLPYPMRKNDHLQRKGRSGFALVIALMLMGFLLLLILGMSTTLWVETYRVQRDQDLELAKENAKMAVLSAIGELQRTLGPDARTSARADISYDNPTDSYQSRWTGVWRMPKPDKPASHPDGIDPRSKPELLTWLVSGNEGLSASDANFSRPDSSTQNAVVLLSEFVHEDVNAGLVKYSEVRAPRVELENGSYAWWIEDEGIKFKVSSVATNYSSADQPVLPLGNSAVFWEEKFNVDFDQAHNFWERVLSYDSISTSNPDIEKLEPHLTLHSYGVLADSLRGGLRLDLSAIMEMTPAEFTTGVLPYLPGERIYEEYLGDFSVGVADDGKGPEWMVLRNFGDLRNAVGSSGATIRPLGRSDAGSKIERVSSLGIFPIMEKFQVYLTVRLVDETPNDPNIATFRPRLYYLPAVVLWNPYDKPITTTQLLRFDWMYRDNKYGWGHNYAAGTYDINDNWVAYTIDGGSSGGLEGEFPLTHSKGDSKRTSFYLRDAGKTLPIVIPPGEALVFTMKENVKLDAASPAASKFDMEPGFRNFGFYVDAGHRFVVPREDMEGENFSGVFVDVRARKDNVRDDIKDVGGFEGFDFRLWLGDGTASLVRMQSFRFKSDEWKSVTSNTVSKLGANKFGKDPNGPEPVKFEAADLGLPSDTTPALSINDVAMMGYEVSLRKPSPKLELHKSYEFEGIRPLASINPRGASNIGQWANFTARNQLYYQKIVFENLYTQENADLTQQIETWDDDRGVYLGFSDSASGSERLVLFHLPEKNEVLNSVGELRHLDLVGTDLSMAVSTEASRKRLEGGPAYVIGEARADPHIPLNVLESLVNGKKNRHVDHQWLANRQIWDRFFASTLPINSPITFPLKNGRIVPRDVSSFNSVFVPNARNTASKLMIDGAFNINSTSVPAWRALLAQFWEQPVSLASGGVEDTKNASAFIDLPEPLSGAYVSGGTAQRELYNGYRQLTASEIDKLAEEIVELVKARGPFVSLADFINRSINPADRVIADDGSDLLSHKPSMADLAKDPRLFGLLQAAIEKAGLNDDFGPSGGFYVGKAEWPWNGEGVSAAEQSLHVPPAAIGPFMEGAPGYLTQGKLLQRLGPVLSARSDTFRIRAYGDVRNPINDRVEARAYAEVLVQRVPEYVDSSEAPETPIGQLQSLANQEFGRQFRIVDFRWLDPKDI